MKNCGHKPMVKMKTGGSVKAAVHKHEREKHRGQPLTKLKAGGKIKKGK
jgi:hypothetical protein